MSGKIVPRCVHTLGHYFDLSLKSLAQKLTEKMFFVKCMLCDLL